MYAIVDIAGKQYRVEKDKYLYTDHLQLEEGAVVSFDKVLLLDINGTVSVGVPTVSGAVVSGKVLEQVRGDKVLIFHKKRRKGYRKLNGHRQNYTKVLIENISK